MLTEESTTVRTVVTNPNLFRRLIRFRCGVAHTIPNDVREAARQSEMHILGAIAEFERARIAERVKAGLQRARAQGKRLGRPRKVPSTVAVPGGSVREAARVWGVSKSTAARWISGVQAPTAVTVADLSPYRD